MVKQISIFLLFLLSLSLRAEKRSDSLLAELNEAQSDTQKVNIYLKLSRRSVTPELSVALKWVQRAEAKSIQSHYDKGLLQSLVRKGYLFQIHGLSDSSIVYFKKALQKRLLKSTKDSADLFNKMGVYFLSVEKPDSALHYLNLAYEKNSRIDHKKGLVEVLVNMGNAFYAKGELEQTLHSFEEAYLKATSIENYKPMAVVLSNYMGIKLLLRNDTANVLESLSMILNHSYVKNNADMEANVYTNMGNFYMHNVKDSSEAENMFLKALNIYEQSDFKVDPLIYSGLGKIYMGKKQFKKAISFFHLSLDLKGNIQNRRTAYENIAQSYTELGMMDSAVYYLNEVIGWMEESQKRKSDELLLKAKTNLDLVKKEAEISKLEDQHQIDVLNQTRSRTILIALGVVLILSITIFLLLLKQKKRQSVLQEAELKLKNQNLVNLSLQINEKNQILKSFERKVVKGKDAAPSLLYKDVKSTLKKSLKIDDDWKKFEVYLNDLHGGFYDTLKKEYPNLTNSELRVCSLSKLRYSLKETAHTLSVSTDSVKSARYRIKKKMSLGAEQDLADFLNSL
ncbi:tetratricopeptide repeat protein [Salibacter halophilus]|uniref:Tetratricopeptide repeat protein n=1 Tax=Salibacter halophilus TaxID=1803916 RepID=A0A6N6M531_9FLAO|nr:tetratricopeptide repeat protein [Salibacter halophilus]KAB1064727.1 tetratricopeptide repeat protein [Salibacter halophilus]